MNKRIEVSPKICLNCGEQYKPKAYRAERARFCSWRCRKAITPEKKFKNECWEWGGRLNFGGYGFVISKGKTFMAHRIAWEQSNGPIPTGLIICHKCDNRKCINPSHMFLGTDADNVADMDRKGRRVILRGADNALSKLSEESVKEIKRRHTGEYGLGIKLAKEFGVAPTTISMIVTGRTWCHVRS